jgi:hypothetical protein
MRIAAGLLGLLWVGLLFAADAPKKITIRPNDAGEVKVGETVYLAYPYKKDHTAKLKRLVIDKQNVVGLKEFHTGPADMGENNVIFKTSKVGKFVIEMEVFREPLENARVEKYRYTLVVRKKDD